VLADSPEELGALASEHAADNELNSSSLGQLLQTLLIGFHGVALVEFLDGRLLNGVAELVKVF